MGDSKIVKKKPYKYCIVPCCTNTTIKTPEKVFFRVPTNALRKKWCRVMRRDEKKNIQLSPVSELHCCEDHFSLENDMENYWQYRLSSDIYKQVRLKPGVLPTIFNCQKRDSPTPVRKYPQKRKIQCAVDQALSEFATSIVKKDVQTKVSGPYSSGSKIKMNQDNPSTSTQEAVLPDIGFANLPGLSEMSPYDSAIYDPNIVIKHEIIETDEEPSNVLDASTTFSIRTSENTLVESSSPNIPNTLLTPIVTLNIGELLPTDKVTVPATSAGMKVTEMSPTVPVRSSKRSKKTDARKVLVKKTARESSDHSASSSEVDEGSQPRPRDKFDAYAEFIASKLRELDPRSCAFVQTAISDLIFEAELGRYLSEGDKSIFANKTQELLKNMPSPYEDIA